ncbi:MAG: twin-arginine translocation signal domain-containing protein [Planctomycetes bacterium]|nr:twin-arginine translocation signal domain-containing protein [Planctomycetota bacterium]
MSQQSDGKSRRDFLRQSVAAAGAIGAAGTVSVTPGCSESGATLAGFASSDQAGRRSESRKGPRRAYNDWYRGQTLSRVAFPMGGIGAGMICLEGTGAFSHVSLRNQPEVFNEPVIFAAICVKGDPNVARVLEGPVPDWKKFGLGGAGNGLGDRAYGLPRFREAAFLARFPFGHIELADPKVKLKVQITGWSPFVPGDPDSASLPAAGLEYTFTNPTRAPIEAVFSFNAKNFMQRGDGDRAVRATPGGFLLHQSGSDKEPQNEGAFCASVSDPETKVNLGWFRGGWFDALTMVWKEIAEGGCFDRPAPEEGGPSPGGTLFVPMRLAAGESRTIVVRLCWYAGKTTIRIGKDPQGLPEDQAVPGSYQPWYSGKFADINTLASFWKDNYSALRKQTAQFSACFYDTTLPPEVVEAVAANLTILKSPTVLRQADGRLWGWEGCLDNRGCCHGSCTHVWNYAQAIPHLFPSLERSLRETEFNVSQEKDGHQVFRSALPIRPQVHDFHAAADGQLGGIMKVHREWRISGDVDWLGKLWPKVRQSLDYCIGLWDPGHKGIVEEPHHNTYDIEFWGPDGMCTSFYLGALAAAVAMGKALGDDVSTYQELLDKGRQYLEKELYNDQYFLQKVQWEGLKAKNPLELTGVGGAYSPEAAELLKQEGPKYQYGNGCLSDGVLGAWLAKVSGVGEVLDRQKVASHLRSVHKYNLKHDLSEHPNPQRPSYACGAEGGLLLCSWPKGGALSLPFVYSNEVWTGIEYQVASHLMLMGLPEQGLEIVRVCRDRYDGAVRNPFNEYECGHWYARAMSSYALLAGMTGARYDAVTKTLHVEPRVKGDFRAFLSTAAGYGTVGVKGGKPFLEVKSGKIEVVKIEYGSAA